MVIGSIRYRPTRKLDHHIELSLLIVCRMEKERLIQIIKEWVRNDNELRTLQKEVNLRKIEKKKMGVHLLEIMRSNKIDCFDLTDGQIMYKKTNVKKPITKTVLLNLLSTYYDGDVGKATELNQFILDNREVVVRESIVRKIDA